MAEKTPEDALKRAIEEVRAGAKDAPHKDVDPTITDLQVAKYRQRFVDTFRRNFDTYGTKKWEDEREDALRMARYIGVLAVFHSEAHQKNQIVDDALAWAIDTVTHECELERDRIPPGPNDKRDVWCS